MPPHKHTLFLFFNGQKTQFTKDVKTANEYMKRCLTSLVNREIQFKTNKNNFTHLRRDKKEKEKEERVNIGTGGATPDFTVVQFCNSRRGEFYFRYSPGGRKTKVHTKTYT